MKAYPHKIQLTSCFKSKESKVDCYTLQNMYKKRHFAFFQFHTVSNPRRSRITCRLQNIKLLPKCFFFTTPLLKHHFGGKVKRIEFIEIRSTNNQGKKRTFYNVQSEKTWNDLSQLSLHKCSYFYLLYCHVILFPKRI